MFKKSLLLIALITLTSTSTFATEILTDLPQGTAKGLVVIAPAKKYLMKERLFTSIAKNLSQAGYITVRLNWSAATLSNPSLELELAAEDIKKVILEAQREHAMPPQKTTLIAKSFSTKVLNGVLELAYSHILLTPNCSNEALFENTYEKILNDSTISLGIIISNEDPYCDVHQIYQTLGKNSLAPVLFTTHGDHNFVVTSASGDKNFSYQDQVIQFVTNILNH